MNKNLIIWAGVLLLTALSCINLSAQSTPLVSAVTISGNKRSSEQYLQDVVAVQPGDFWYKSIEEDIHTRLRKEKIFIDSATRIDSIQLDDGYGNTYQPAGAALSYTYSPCYGFE